MSTTARGDFKRFTDWIRARGVTTTAAELQVTPRAIWGWIYVETKPTPDKAQALVALSQDFLSLEDIYAGVKP